MVDNESRGAHWLSVCWPKTLDPSTNLRCDHCQDCDASREKGELCNYSNAIQLATSKQIHPSEKTTWLNDLCKHEKQSNINSDQYKDEEQGYFEPLLVLKLSELNRLKESGWEKDQIRKTLLTLNIRNILLMLRLMKEQRMRWIIHIKLNFTATTTMGGGCPTAWKHMKAAHWKW